MSSRCLEGLRRFAATLWLCSAGGVGASDLVVCADPDLLPYSNAERNGFENRIVELVAEDLGDRVIYRWQPFRRGVVRKTLGAHVCDVLAGVPVGMKGVATTAAYYRSGYAFVSRRDLGAPIVSFADPRLRNASVGVQLIGADMAATPAALALARHGIVANVTGIPLYGVQPAAQRMIDAMDRGELDVVVAWGPQVGYFAARAKTPLVIALAAEDNESPMTFAIAFAVREDDETLRDRLDRALVHVREQIDRTLAEFNVPMTVIGPAGVNGRP